MSAGTITIKLKKSLVSTTVKQKANAAGLGVKKIGDLRTLENTPSVRGMIKKMINFIDIIEEK
ncbi:50S ribosomal protein L30 [Bacteriovoracaceae bacterium]|nr:50S ribosomal protein L30 [Bacteriovoracaceae bacterium]